MRIFIATCAAALAFLSSAFGQTTTYYGNNVYASGSTLDITNATKVGFPAGGDVTGPASSVDSEVSLFSGTTGKTLKRATGSGIATLASGVLGTTTNNSSNWDTAFSERRQWDGGSTNLTAATGRTSLGGTTVGQNFFLLATPGSISFPKVTNISGAVTLEDAATHRASIGAGTGSGSVTSIATTSPVSGGTITTTGTISLNLGADFNFTTPQTFTLTNSNTATSDTILKTVHLSTGTVGTGFGTTWWNQLENAGGTQTDAGQIQNNWSAAGAGSEVAYWDFLLRSGGSLSSKMRIHGEGSISVGTTTAGGSGYVNANTGYKIAGTDIFPLTTARGGVPTGGGTGQVLTKNTGTNYDYGWKTFMSANVPSIANPAGISGATQKMLGYGQAANGTLGFTPTVNGKVLIMLHGGVQVDTNTASSVVTMKYGTGAAPANQATVTGSSGSQFVIATAGRTANATSHFTLIWIASGLTVNTAYWVDIAAASGAAGQTTSCTGVYLQAVELP